MIKIEKLTKYYGDLLAVDNLSLEVEKGKCFGFIGPNGAGKSTTIRCIMNLINKTSGNILINNKVNDMNDTSIKEIIGYLPSEINLYEDLTVKEMINYSGSFYKTNVNKKVKDLVKRFKVDVNKKINELSFGNLKKVGIVLAFMHSPKILILDEATNGLDPLMQEEFYKLILEEKERGTTIFYSTHNLNEVKKICDEVGIIKEGKLIVISRVDKLIEKSFLIIDVESNEIDKLGIKKFISKEKNHLRFIYSNDINDLLKELSKIEIKKLIIEEPSIEELFLHYYK